MVNDVDQNDNGMIEFNEFLQMMSKKMREGDSEDELKEAFKWVILIVKWNCYVTQSPASFSSPLISSNVHYPAFFS